MEFSVEDSNQTADGVTESFVKNGLYDLSRKDRLFLFFDALLCPMNDDESMLFDILSSNNALPPRVYSPRDLPVWRRSLQKKGAFYAFGLNSGMLPAARFVLSKEAANSPETAVFLRNFCTESVCRVHPVARGLSQITALYQNSPEVYRERCRDAFFLEPRITHIENSDIDRDWYAGLAPYLQAMLFEDMAISLYYDNALNTAFAPAVTAWMDGKLQKADHSSYPVHASVLLWAGKFTEMREVIARERKLYQEDSVHACILEGMELFLNRQKRALECFEEVASLYRKKTSAKGALRFGMNIGLFRALSLFLYGSETQHKALRQELFAINTSSVMGAKAAVYGEPGFRAILALDYLRSGDVQKARDLVSFRSARDASFLSVLIFEGTRIRLGLAGKDDVEELRLWYWKAEGLPFLRRFFADLLYAVLPDGERGQYARTAEERGLFNFSEIVTPSPEWKLRLSALENILSGTAEGSGSKSRERRLCWFIDLRSRSVTPVEQVWRGHSWSKGRAVSLGKMRENGQSVPWYTDQDRAIASCSIRDGWGKGPFSLPLELACGALDGHPLIFAGDKGSEAEPSSVREGHLELSLGDRNETQCRLSIGNRDIRESPDLEDFLETPGKTLFITYVDGAFVYYRLTEKQKKVLELLSQALDFPRSELPELLAKVRVGENIPLKADLETEEIATVSTPVIQLEQKETSFAARIGVRPFGQLGTPFYPTGEGVETPIAAVSPQGDAAGIPEMTRPVKTHRDFEAEKEALASLINDCPALEENLEKHKWFSQKPEDVLELLEQLKSSTVPNTVEWPRGAGLRVRRTIGPASMHVTIRKNSQDWFAFSGTVQLDEKNFLSMEKFLKSLKDSRFVSLGNGEYVALTEELRRHLSSLRLMARDKGRALEVDPITAGSLDKVLEGMDVEADEAWTASRERMQEAFASSPQVPSLLRAELRDYQKEGYEWMQRLAIWGVGACLADDMGLGKTVQTIAVMLNQAKKGPVLIVCPTSVCANWEDEIGRFAPSLTVKRMGTTDREKTVTDMAAGEVLILGYGLLTFVSDLLVKQTWSMLVFDEAQALKNAHTKRAAAAHRIPADFRVALTGTPIENRIEDLWSIFHIINPGLLGGWEYFHSRFGSAEPGTAASKTLRSMIRPFILRRLKSAVLDELPPRTEQTLVVEPNQKEVAFYESVRRGAVKAIQEGDEKSRRFTILKYLMKLRRICCHPALADPDMAAMEKESSKTARFLEIVGDLIAGGHKVLAFSQFTSYLAVIGDALKERRISYQYLDGATPEKERRARVAAFQAGEGDVFLLSLKAGGTGINLTAADYVIHLDPWWNPAVEDQASDRAHRMGQKRPVTIYRLVMAGSVEEKILNIHDKKRELAADFLEGTSSSVKSLSEEELLALLQ